MKTAAVMPRAAFPAPSADPTVGFGPVDRRIPVYFCIHMPAGQPFVDVAQAITALAATLNGYWDYQYSVADGHGHFHIHLASAQETPL